MNEVEVCYLNEKGVFQSRKRLTYNTTEKALEIFNNTFEQFKDKTNALITLRKFDNKYWTLLKAERTKENKSDTIVDK